MLSAVILAQNEEEHIEQCITSLKFCDEIILIDDNSTDNTVKIAKKLGAIVHTRSLKNDFSAQRAYGTKKATHDWILYVDADEVVSKTLQNEILKAINHPLRQVGAPLLDKEGNQRGGSDSITAYYIRRRDHFWGQTVIHGELSTAYHTGFIRLIKKDAGEWRGEVHETFMPSGKTSILNGYIDHYPHQNITTFLQEINHYSTLRAQEFLRAGKKATLFEIMMYPFGKFMYTYLVKQGFRDGAAGFVYSFLMSFHSFLVRAKLYQHQNIAVKS